MKPEQNEERKPYARPELRRVKLEPEESLVAGCKTLSGPGGVTNCNVGDCFGVGS